jgi:hypothetical protein
MSSSSDWDAASPEDWAIAAAREAVIRPLVEAGPVTVAIAIEAAKTLGISRSMLYRLIARFRAQAELSTLLTCSGPLPGDRARRRRDARGQRRHGPTARESPPYAGGLSRRPRVATLVRTHGALARPYAAGAHRLPESGSLWSLAILRPDVAQSTA